MMSSSLVETATIDTVARARLGRGVAGGWTLRSVIGVGGTAAVYRATHEDGRVSAIKVAHSHLAGEPGWLRRMKREAELLETLAHPGLALLLDVQEVDGGAPCLVMELLEGHSLEELRRAGGGALPLADVFGYARDVLEVLAHAHAMGVVHRDLKPSNVFRTTSGRLKVLDFGIASSPARVIADGALASSTRGILGTPAFMAPEQARGRFESVDHRTDLWAVGAMMFTLASGELVHVAGTENERLGLAMSRRARSLASALPHAERSAVRVVDRALAYDPSDRFQSAVEFGAAIESAIPTLGRNARSIGHVPDATVRDVVPQDRERSTRVGRIVVPGVVLVLLGAGVHSLSRERATSMRSPAFHAVPSPVMSQAPPAPLVSSAVQSRLGDALPPAPSFARVQPTPSPSKAGSGARDITTPSRPVRGEASAGRPTPSGEDLMDRRE